MRNQNRGVHFLKKFAVDLDEIQNFATTFCFVEAYAKFSCTNKI